MLNMFVILFVLAKSHTFFESQLELGMFQETRFCHLHDVSRNSSTPQSDPPPFFHWCVSMKSSKSGECFALHSASNAGSLSCVVELVQPEDRRSADSQVHGLPEEESAKLAVLSHVCVITCRRFALRIFGSSPAIGGYCGSSGSTRVPWRREHTWVRP